MGQSQDKEQMRGDFSNHERLKNYKIVKARNGKQYMQVPCPIFDIKIIPQWQNNMKSITNKECLFFPQSFEVVEEGRCGSSGTLKMMFEYYPFSLHKQIANRKQLKSPFNEQQLWFLLYEITSSVIEFENLGKKSGDIRPKNIFINEDGLIKVVTQYSFPDERVNYMKALQDHESAYLSPEQLAEFQKGIVHSRSDPVIGQAFSIGLTMLDAALLTDNEELYEMKNLRFNIHKFHENIIKWKESSYSPFLIRTVENLLEINWYERPTAGEVRAVLEPYEQQIRNLEPFSPSKQKSKAMLDSYQTGSKKKKSSHDPKINTSPLMQNPVSKPATSLSPQHYTVKINTYPHHHIPYTHSTPQIYVQDKRLILSQENVAQMNARTRAASPAPKQVIRHHPKEMMVPAPQMKIVPNSRAYLQTEEKHFS